MKEDLPIDLNAIRLTYKAKNRFKLNEDDRKKILRLLLNKVSLYRKTQNNPHWSLRFFEKLQKRPIFLAGTLQ